MPKTTARARKTARKDGKGKVQFLPLTKLQIEALKQLADQKLAAQNAMDAELGSILRGHNIAQAEVLGVQVDPPMLKILPDKPT